MIKAVIFDYGGVLNKRLRLQHPLLELAAELRRKGIKTGLLSNMIRPLAWWVRAWGRVDDFDPVIFCYGIGANKPDPRSYQAIIKELGLKPNECLFVDNRADNIAGAQALGMQTVHDKNTTQTAKDIRSYLTRSR